MSFYQKRPFSFLLYFCLFVFALFKIDHYFFKKNESFCFRNMCANLPFQSEWTIDPARLPSESETACIFRQSFRYLNKGHQSYVFESEDHNYVIKFYRLPSHLRALPWLNRPFAYHFNSKRQKTKNYNLEKLDITFKSYKLAFEELKKESGLVYVHLNKTANLKRKLKIVDKLGIEYAVDLDTTPFAIQRKAQLIFPTLEHLIQQNDLETAKKIILNVIEMIISRSQKGIVDEDSILEKNYGLIGTHAIHIDFGRFAKKKKLQKSRLFIQQETLKTTESLKNWLADHHEELFQFYQNAIQSHNISS